MKISKKELEQIIKEEIEQVTSEKAELKIPVERYDSEFFMEEEVIKEGYYSKGKCVYKKEDDSKVGCTDGPVKDYLAALYANVEDAK